MKAAPCTGTADDVPSQVCDGTALHASTAWPARFRQDQSDDRRAGDDREWLPRLVGRSRALEIVLGADDFDADVAERYGWMNRALDDDDLEPFVDELAGRLASFD